MSSTLWKCIRFSAIVICAVLVSSPTATGHSGDVLSHFAHVTVDGVKSPGEYDGNSCTGPKPFKSSPTSPTTYTLNICASNDGTNDYYAVTIDDLTYDPSDVLSMWFDNTHNGIIDPCFIGSEDELNVFPAPLITDGYYCRNFDGNVGIGGEGLVNGAVAVTFNETTGYTYEFSHPMNSGDPADYSLSPGDTVGFCLTYNNVNIQDDSFYGTGLQYPPGCFDDLNTNHAALDHFGDFRQISELEQNLHNISRNLISAITRFKRFACLTCPPILRRLEEVERQIESALSRASSPNTLEGPNRLRGTIGELGGLIHELEARRGRLGLDPRTVDNLIADLASIQRDLQGVVGGSVAGR